MGIENIQNRSQSVLGQNQVEAVSQLMFSVLKQSYGPNSIPDQLIQMLKANTANQQSSQSQLASGHIDIRV